MRKRTFVLVHGAWHGGWCWRRLADLLEPDGHKVYAPSLTGLGDRSHLLTADVTLQTHIADICNLIKWEGLSDIVLVGHSYAGLVVTGVTTEISERISSIVLIDAFYPQVGDSMAALTPLNRKLVDDALANGSYAIRPIPAAAFGVNSDDRDWVDRSCTPHPVRTFIDPISSVEAREKLASKTYIRADGFSSAAFDKAFDAAQANGWEARRLPGGHDLMIDSPEMLASALAYGA